MTPLLLKAPEFRSSNSFAKIARNHAVCLDSLGIDVYLHECYPSTVGDCIPLHQKECISRLLQKPIPVQQPYHTITYDTPDTLVSVPREYVLPFVLFETATLRNEWIQACKTQHHICTISEANRRLLLDHCIDPEAVTTVHCGYDPLLYSPQARPLWPVTDQFVFLFVGHFHPRKGVDLLLDAYCQEFNNGERVLLRLFTQSMFNTINVNALVNTVVSRYPTHPDIEVITHPFNHGVSEHDMAGVYTSAQCLVIPTKGEAFGLPFLEAKACGLEVIATRCSGQLDFLTDENAHFIEVDRLDEDPACTQFYKGYAGLKFWIPSLQSLRNQMRMVFEGARKPSGIQGWTWQETTARLLEALSYIPKELIWHEKY